MPWTVRYTYQFKDYRAVVRALRGRVPYDLLWVAGIYLGTIAVMAYWQGRLVPMDTRNLRMLIGGLVLALAVASIAMRTAHWLFFRRSALANTVVELTVAEDGLHFVSRVSSGTVSWQAVERVIENKRGLYLAISKIEAIAIPRRAVSQADFRSIRELARQRLRPASLS